MTLYNGISHVSSSASTLIRPIVEIKISESRVTTSDLTDFDYEV